MHDDLNDIAQSLLTAADSPRSAAPLPSHLPTPAQAYALQRRIAERNGSAVAAWKLGLTSEAARDAFGTDQPTAGRLGAGSIRHDGDKIEFVGPEMFAEAELIFEIGADLPVLDRPYTQADLCAVLKGVYAGIEIVRTRFETSDVPLSLLIADNSMAHALVLGRKLAEGWDERFADMPVSLTRNNEETVEGTTARVMGNPLNALVWLANWLRDHEGCSLKREQLVASGTCTGATEIFADDTIRVIIDNVESARITLRAPEPTGR